MDVDIILNEFVTPKEAAELGVLAESYGIRGVWACNYGDSRDPFFTLSLLAAQSEKLLMGPLALSPYEMHPLKIANLLFSLNELSQGRGMITLSGGGAVLQSIGKKRERMIRVVRECLEILRGANPDEALNYEGEIFQVRNYKPTWYTDKPPLLYVGSNYPQSLRLATRLADGLMTSDFHPTLMKDCIADIDTGLAKNNRKRSDFRISNFWAWHIKEDPKASLFEARRELVLRGYLGEKYFKPFLDDDEIAFMRRKFPAFLQAFLQGNDVIEGVPDDLINKMIENISFAGGLDAIDGAVEELKQFGAMGVTDIALRVHDDPEQAIRLIGEHVLPKL